MRVRVDLEVPSATIVGSDIVEFNGTIQEVIVSRSFDDVPIDVVNLDRRFDAELDQATGLLRLRGPQLVMEALDSSQIGLIVDCTSVEETGEAVLQLDASYPDETEMTDLVPDEVRVTITEATPIEQSPPARAPGESRDNDQPADSDQPGDSGAGAGT